MAFSRFRALLEGRDVGVGGLDGEDSLWWAGLAAPGGTAAPASDSALYLSHAISLLAYYRPDSSAFPPAASQPIRCQSGEDDEGGLHPVESPSPHPVYRPDKPCEIQAPWKRPDTSRQRLSSANYSSYSGSPPSLYLSSFEDEVALSGTSSEGSPPFAADSSLSAQHVMNFTFETSADLSRQPSAVWSSPSSSPPEVSPLSHVGYSRKNESPKRNKSLASLANLRLKSKGKGGNFCTFCFNNKEADEVVMSHNLRSTAQGVAKLTCPVLRKYVCPVCGKTGDEAHTKTYCPQIIRSNGDRRPVPIAYSLNSCRRFFSKERK